MKTVRLTMAQAFVRYLCVQYTEVEGRRERLFAGVFGIFGHGNVTCFGEALESVQDILPTWRGQNEQSMALAAIGYAKAMRRRQIMVATSSIGPGATNMVTAAALAHANRLPVMIVSGDVFASRRSDPVLQQVEHFGDPTVSVNDAYRSVCRYWDRITHPEQIVSSLPQAVGVLLDPADCGPVFIGLCQDTQELAYDYPEEFFEERDHRVLRSRPDEKRLEEASELLKGSKRPLVISGGGVRYSGAEDFLGEWACRRGIPVAETVSGKGGLVHDNPCHVGPVGVLGGYSANELAGEADVIVAVGTRLQDFTTGSWTLFSGDAKFVSLNAGRWDATKHRALSVIGDAYEGLKGLDEGLGDYKAPEDWTRKGVESFRRWNEVLDSWQNPEGQNPKGQNPKNTTENTTEHPTYGQVVGVVNGKADKEDVMVTAAGGLPSEVVKGWRVKLPHTFDCEFGFSCMGYEIAGGWGHAMARGGRGKKGVPIVMVGDGSYMMMNSDVYSSVLSGHKMIVVVCDNGGYAVINRLQNAKGCPSFNNLIKDSRVERVFSVDFAKHAESMGACAKRVSSLSELSEAMEWAKGTDRTTVIVIKTDGFTWTPGDALWDVGVPEESDRKEVREARRAQDEIRAQQRRGV